jgi:hypothetical protein
MIELQKTMFSCYKELESDKSYLKFNSCNRVKLCYYFNGDYEL